MTTARGRYQVEWRRTRLLSDDGYGPWLPDALTPKGHATEEGARKHIERTALGAGVEARVVKRA